MTSPFWASAWLTRFWFSGMLQFGFPTPQAQLAHSSGHCETPMAER